MREILTEATSYITQGTIFNNAICNHYTNSFGLIITARCDIENNHHDSVNYLPVVKLNDWVKHEFVKILLKRTIKDTESKLKNVFGEKKLSLDAIKYLGVDKILETHFKDKERKSVSVNLRTLEINEKLNNGGITDDDVNHLCDNNEKTSERILKELINNELNGYFYIENCEYYKQKNSICEHYVVLLRELHSLPMEIAKQLLFGIEVSKGSPEEKYFSSIGDAMAESEVKSPYIECIIQSCMTQFRIGIDRANYLNLETIRRKNEK